ncbi:hypothetical protein D3C87_1332910 [compost metagenome]
MLQLPNTIKSVSTKQDRLPVFLRLFSLKQQQVIQDRFEFDVVILFHLLQVLYRITPYLLRHNPAHPFVYSVPFVVPPDLPDPITLPIHQLPVLFVYPDTAETGY